MRTITIVAAAANTPPDAGAVGITLIPALG